MIIDRGDIAARTLLSKVDPANSRLLEIGCGDGRITRKLQGKFKKLIAIDPDSGAIQQARQQLPEIDFRVASGEAPDIGGGPFDTILFSLSLHHMDSVKALDAVDSLLADEGEILVIEPSVESPISLLCNVFQDETEVLVNAAQAIRRSNYTIISVEEVHTTWVFEGKDELYDWLYSFYGQDPDPFTRKHIDTFLGASINDCPITIADILILTRLRRV